MVANNPCYMWYIFAQFTFYLFILIMSVFFSMQKVLIFMEQRMSIIFLVVSGLIVVP